MPNHVTNILEVIGSKEAVEQCLNSMRTESTDEDTGKSFTRHIDFNTILPMPESMNITSGSSTDNAIDILTNNTKRFLEMLDYSWVKERGITTVKQVVEYLKGKLDEKEMEEGRTALQNIETYGCKDWYEWANKYWGTKWNAYSQTKIEITEEKIGDTTLYRGGVKFDTAWATPYPVIEALAKKHPELEFKVQFADEDLGHNCGEYRFLGGELTAEYEPHGTEAFAFACEVKGINPDEQIIENLEWWDLERFDEEKKSIIGLLEKGYGERMVETILQKEDDEETEGKLEFIRLLALDRELYEVAAKTQREKESN